MSGEITNAQHRRSLTHRPARPAGWHAHPVRRTTSRRGGHRPVAVLYRGGSSSRGTRLRIAAIFLAILTAIVQLGVFALSEAQRQTALLDVTAAQPWWGRALWAVGWALPWAIGAVVLAWARVRVGTAVIVSLAVLALPQAIGTAQLLTTLDDVGATGLAWAAALGGAAAWGTGTAAGLTAWFARPRGAWRADAPGPGALFTVAAIAAWLPTAFRSTAFAPPGAPRRFLEPLATGIDLTSSPAVLTPLIVALVLLVAPRLTEVVAGAVTLTFAAPQFVSQVVTIRSAVLTEFTIPTPPGVLGLLGLAVLVVIGLVWLAAPHRTVSDGARDPGREPEG